MKWKHQAGSSPCSSAYLFCICSLSIPHCLFVFYGFAHSQLWDSLLGGQFLGAAWVFQGFCLFLGLLLTCVIAVSRDFWALGLMLYKHGLKKNILKTKWVFSDKTAGFRDNRMLDRDWGVMLLRGLNGYMPNYLQSFYINLFLNELSGQECHSQHLINLP